MLGLTPQVKMMNLKLSTLRKLDSEVDFLAGPGHPASALRQGTTSPDRIAIVGEDGYLFISNGSNRWEDQYLGKIDYDVSFFMDWISILEARQYKAEQHGTILWNMIVPEKHVLYATKRWGTEAPSGATRPVHRLLQLLSPSCRLVYPEVEMREALPAAPIYSKHDSHWTPSGCAVAMRALLANIADLPDIENLQFSVGRHYAAGDLTAHFFMQPPVEDMVSFGINGRLESCQLTHETTGSFRGSRYALSNRSAPDPRTVVVFGDSYSFTGGVTYVLSAVFRKVYFCWSKDVLWDIAERESADIIIWEHAERYITSVPGA